MKLTNEQIQEEIAYCEHMGHEKIAVNIDALQEILELRQEVERLKSDLKIAMSVVDEVVQSAIECSNIEADDLQSWLVKEGVLKVVPFDPTKHYDYEHETKEGQDWITWSDWYEEKREQDDE